MIPGSPPRNRPASLLQRSAALSPDNSRSKDAAPLRVPMEALRFTSKSANLSEPVSASAMVSPLPCSCSRNREKPLFSAAEVRRRGRDSTLGLCPSGGTVHCATRGAGPSLDRRYRIDCCGARERADQIVAPRLSGTSLQVGRHMRELCGGNLPPPLRSTSASHASPSEGEALPRVFKWPGQGLWSYLSAAGVSGAAINRLPNTLERSANSPG